MSKRGPSQDEQLRISAEGAESVLDTEDDPELSLPERLDRAANRFEVLFQQWQQIGPDTDIDSIQNRIDEWIGHMDHVTARQEHSGHDMTRSAEAAVASTRKGDRRSERGKLRKRSLTEEQRRQRYHEAEQQAEKRVIDHYGAALWKERPGNHERLDALHELLQQHRMRRSAARAA